jgi:hypothetical protein
MPWLFVVSLLAAGSILLVIRQRSDQTRVQHQLLAAGVDFAVTSLLTAFVVDRIQAFRKPTPSSGCTRS